MARPPEIVTKRKLVVTRSLTLLKVNIGRPRRRREYARLPRDQAFARVPEVWPEAEDYQVTVHDANLDLRVRSPILRV